MARRVLFFIIGFLMRGLTLTQVNHVERIPPSGQGIVVINHLGRLDAAILFLAVPRTDITGWVAEKYQRVWIMRVMVRVLNGIWINRFEADRKALKAAVDWLKAGRMLGIAPEGTRSPTGALIQGKRGAAYLADLTGAPIIPAGIVTPPYPVRDALLLRRPRLSITFGEPFRLPPVARERREQALDENTDEIMCRIAALLPPELHGVYAGHPKLMAPAGKGINPPSIAQGSGQEKPV